MSTQNYPSRGFTAIQFTLGDKLRKLRTLNNLSQEVMAQLLGVNRNTVLHYETGRIQDLRPAILMNWCAHTGGRPSEVMGPEYAKYDEAALAKFNEIKDRQALEMVALRAQAPGVDPFGDILALDSGDDADQGQTSPWRFPGAPDQWVVAS